MTAGSQNKPKYFFEPELEEKSELVLVTRCSLRGEGDEILESPGEIFLRVAKFLARAELNWGEEKEMEKVAAEFFKAMAERRLIITRSALYEAGNPKTINQLSPCFVVPIGDSIDSIFESLGQAAVIQKSYGGTGFNFSQLRPRGDKVRNVPDAASGPVEFLRVYSAALSRVKQGVKRHGANMGILNVDHPDVVEFIGVKDQDETIKNFNLSVGIKDEYMEAVQSDDSWSLVNPRNDKVIQKIAAGKLYSEICQHAWLTGDPGMIFLDRLEEDNFTPSLGKIDATNPCGEQPLLPYESCNLSSINLDRHVRRDGPEYQLDWEALAKTTRTIVRLLDNMIEMNTYVLPQTEKIVRYGNRKIGAGVIGFAHVLYKLGIPYGSAEAVDLARQLASFIKEEQRAASQELAQTRGPFPNFDISTYAGGDELRNCTTFTIAPTGTVSMIGNTTPGIEPAFALAYERRTFFEKDHRNRPGQVLRFVDPVLQEVLTENGLYTEELAEKIVENAGSLQGIDEIPDQLQEVFLTTHDIDWEGHVRIQAAWQESVDNSVSKTINLPHEAKPRDIEEAFMLAWQLGCKGCTVYRDGCKRNQVIATKKTKELEKEQ